MPETSGSALLQMTGIHKRFPGVHALKGVDLAVKAGEVHALVGENGAGKSTLMHLLAGVYGPDEGTITFNGQSNVRIENERMAQDLGIGMVFQERSLVPALSVAENVYFSRQPGNSLGIIDHGRLYAETRARMDELGLDMDPRTLLGSLSPAQQQMVEIAKALSLNAKLMIFDEPTAALTDTETKALFQVIEHLKDRGVGIVYISHRLEEIFQIADRVTVLKDGEWRGTFKVGETNPDALISLMVGRDFLRNLDHTDPAILASRPVMLEVRHVSDATRVTDVSFSVRQGEILALAGLAGAGRTELALAVFGAGHRTAGEILVNGQAINVHTPADAIAAGIGYLPEDRREAGLFLDMSIARNIAAIPTDRFGSWWVRDNAIFSVASSFRDKLRIATPDVFRRVQNLSGGNQQKVVLAKWLLLNPKVLIVDEPTRGVDVGAKAEVHGLLRDLARQGTAVVLISSELPEVLAVADRIVVMCEGRVSGELPARQATEEEILRYASSLSTNGGA